MDILLVIGCAVPIVLLMLLALCLCQAAGRASRAEEAEAFRRAFIDKEK